MDGDDLLEIFTFNKLKNETICALCFLKFKGFNKHNLKRHRSTCITKHQNSKESETLAGKKHFINLSVTTRQIVESCLKVVTVQGKPFADLNSVAFRKLFEPVIE